ncbi:hypothetical protein FHX15_003175 [Rhizobium sp. BK650]|nr:hypothetical protein [Rhizobium sp. BK650]
MRLRPGLFVAQHGIIFLNREIEALLQQVARVAHAIDDTLFIHIEDCKWDLQVLPFDGIVDLASVGHEPVDIRLQKDNAIRIKRFDEPIHDPGGQGIVKRNGFIAVARKKLCTQLGSLGLPLQRRQNRRRCDFSIGGLCDCKKCTKKNVGYAHSALIQFTVAVVDGRSRWRNYGLLATLWIICGHSLLKTRWKSLESGPAQKMKPLWPIDFGAQRNPQNSRLRHATAVTVSAPDLTENCKDPRSEFRNAR